MAWAHGSGGVGKTTLLKKFARDAAARGISVVRVDLRDVEATAHALLWSLALALNVRADEVFEPDTWPEDRYLLLLDSCDAFGAIDGWIRETLVTRLPPAVSVVIASRHPPGEAWRTDGDWRAITEVITLHALSPDESREYLTLRRVPSSDHQNALEFAHGHPLALALIAELVATAPGRPFCPELAPDVVQALVRVFVDCVPTPVHRAALELCALARNTNEALIAAVLEAPDPHALFDWLCRLSIVQMDEAGIFPHEVAREVIQADLRWRDPDRFASMRDRAQRFYMNRFDRHRIADQQRSVADAMFLRRDHPIVRKFGNWVGLDRLSAEQATAADAEEIRALIAKHEGDRSAAIALHWLDRQPGSAVVLRERSGRLAGFCSFVALERTTAEERELDPAAVAVWAHLQNQKLLDDGRVTLNRHWMARDGYQNLSVVQYACALLVAHYHYVTASISHFFGVFAHPWLYSLLFSFTGFERIPGAEFMLDEKKYTIVGRDWREESPLKWFQQIVRKVSGEQAPESAPGVLSRADFVKAVRDALRAVLEPHRLSSNPLIDSQLLRNRAGCSSTTGDRVALLQTILRETVATLAETPRGAKFAAAIDRTYLDPVGTQEETAEALDLPFSTYRRHLVSGIEEVIEILWQRENDL